MSVQYRGMDRESMKEAVMQKLAIGQQYQIKSVSATPNDNPVDTKCRLTELSRNVAVFIHKNGTSESFTYQELWMQMMAGTFA